MKEFDDKKSSTKKESHSKASKKKFPAKNGKKESSKPKMKQTAPPVDNDYEEEVNIPVAYDNINLRLKALSSMLTQGIGHCQRREEEARGLGGHSLAKYKNFILLLSLMS